MIALIGSQASGLRSPGKILRPARLDTWLLLNDLHQVRHFGHHAANRGRVRPLDYLVKPRKTQSLDYLFLRSEEHTSELQSQSNLVCRLLLEKKKHPIRHTPPRRSRAPQTPS